MHAKLCSSMFMTPCIAFTTDSMGLAPWLLKSIRRKGYRLPTPIQRRAIPIILQGSDVIGMARTGSGKTAAFVIPLLQKLAEHAAKAAARGLILSPTRELVLQTHKVCLEGRDRESFSSGSSSSSGSGGSSGGSSGSGGSSSNHWRAVTMVQLVLRKLMRSMSCSSSTGTTFNKFGPVSVSGSTATNPRSKFAAAATAVAPGVQQTPAKASHACGRPQLHVFIVSSLTVDASAVAAAAATQVEGEQQWPFVQRADVELDADSCGCW